MFVQFVSMQEFEQKLNIAGNIALLLVSYILQGGRGEVLTGFEEYEIESPENWNPGQTLFRFPYSLPCDTFHAVLEQWREGCEHWRREVAANRQSHPVLNFFTMQQLRRIQTLVVQLGTT